jgi:hypothetical protein
LKQIWNSLYTEAVVSSVNCMAFRIFPLYWNWRYHMPKWGATCHLAIRINILFESRQNTYMSVYPSLLTQERYELFLRITAWAATPTFVGKFCLQCCGQFQKKSQNPMEDFKSVDHWNPNYIPRMCLSRKHSDAALLYL